ncbi:MAG: hypothetical protein EHM42_00620 [Planctomycetaceae bacterium]|nr:MAG: hypothetical protein EHM42_00620 [Planctomycetaceae bacterium]
MPFDKPTGGENHQGFVLCCNLQSLQARSQVDFEIDFFEQILSRDPAYIEVLFRLGDLFAQKGLHRRALHVDLKLASVRPDDPTVFYNLACTHGAQDHEQPALDALERAVELGFNDVDYMLSDPDLLALRLHPRFRRLVERLQRGSTSRSTVV